MTIKTAIYVRVYFFLSIFVPKFQRKCKGARASTFSTSHAKEKTVGRSGLKAIRLISRYYLTSAGGNVIATMCVAKTNGWKIEQLPRNGISIISALTRYFNEWRGRENQKELLCQINEKGGIIVLIDRHG